jgi:hypothetical protein
MSGILLKKNVDDSGADSVENSLGVERRDAADLDKRLVTENDRTSDASEMIDLGGSEPSTSSERKTSLGWTQIGV